MTRPLRVNRRCAGFGVLEGVCAETAGHRNPIWCDRCNDLRIAHLDRRMDEIRRLFPDEEGARP
jgi:hypothetical protein